MNADMWFNIIPLLAFLILVGAGIARRGQPIGKLALQAAIWVGIIGLLWLVAVLVTGIHR